MAVVKMDIEKGKGSTSIDTVQKMAGSVQSLSSQEVLDTALRDLIKTSNVATGIGFCRGEPLTDRGKQKQLIKMLALLFIPVLALWCLALQGLSDDVTEKNETGETMDFLHSTIEIGKMARRLQQERDLSVFFYTALGPSTKSFLLDEYSKTDASISELSGWPVDLDRNKRPEFVTKEAFQVSLAAHRARLGVAGQTLYNELDFYSSAIGVCVQWIYDSLKESKYGMAWRSLVAYVKIIAAREDVGFERALGSVFFVNGEFTRPEDYHHYLNRYFVSKLLFRAAQNMSPLVVSISEYGIQFEERNLTNAIAGARKQIIYNGLVGVAPSLEKGQFWYDSMSLYLDILLEQQKEVADKISALLDGTLNTKLNKVVVSSILLVFVVLLSPLVFMAIQSLTSDIQRYALTLVDKTKELSREKRKTDSLIYQMVPKPVAEILKTSGEVDAEYFKEVTVFFSAIVGFAEISSHVTPMEVVTLLNNLYKFMDNVLDRYDAYKVETINDTYMITSGLPTRNGNKHATELANLALHLIEVMTDTDTAFIPNRAISLRIGINSGPVVAGVIGSKMPRYCLFGDTVNTASRLETNGQPNKIHIGPATRRFLRKAGGYVIQTRGSIHLKGKGNLLTYWLVGKGNITDCDDQFDMADDENEMDLPGEITYGSKDASKIIFKPSGASNENSRWTQKSLEQMAATESTIQPQEGIHY